MYVYGPPRILKGIFTRACIRPHPIHSIRLFSSSPDDEVLVEKINRKLVLSLNRPKALNALNLPMIRKMYPLLKSCQNGHFDLVLIKGAGQKAFCAGGDVVAVSKSYKSGDLSNRIFEEFFREEYQLNYLIGSLKQPYISLIDGITMGGGCGLSMHGPFRVATERTVLAMPETALGLYPEMLAGATFYLDCPASSECFLHLQVIDFMDRMCTMLVRSLPHRRSRRREAFPFFECFPSTDSPVEFYNIFIREIHMHIESGDLSRLQDTLLALPSAKCNSSEIGVLLRSSQPASIASFSLDPHLDTIDECFGAPTVECILDRLGKKAREEGNEFAREQQEALTKMSPTSLKVTFRQVREGANLNFDEIFPMEYRITQRFMAANDFHEGCRAILIDKDRNPKWKPNSLAKVTDKCVDAYFATFDSPERELKLDKFV